MTFFVVIITLKNVGDNYGVIMKNFFSAHLNWNGSARDLAFKANEWFLENSSSQFKEITERLVRDYVSREILDRPERKGKEAVFFFRQLCQLIAARQLVDANWPLDDIEREFRGQTTNAIMSFIPGPGTDENTESTNDLIDEFRHEAGYGLASNRQRLRKRKIDQAQQRVDISSALQNIGSNLSNVIKEDFTAFQLATWMILFVDQNRAASLTIQQAEQIGRAITAALLNPNSLNTQDYQNAATSDARKKSNLLSDLQWEREQRLLDREQSLREKHELEFEINSLRTEIEKLKQGYAE